MILLTSVLIALAHGAETANVNPTKPTSAGGELAGDPKASPTYQVLKCVEEHIRPEVFSDPSHAAADPNMLSAPRTVLDLGTGSGAIALSIACERPQATVYGVDAAPAALLLARRNACRLMPKGCGSQPTFLLGHWYQPVADQRFDLIVANPPYIDNADPHLQQGDLRFEPRAALTPGGNGLAALAEIIAGAPRHLSEGGCLLCEHGYDQAQAVRLLFHAAGLHGAQTMYDLAGIPRVTIGHATSFAKQKRGIA